MILANPAEGYYVSGVTGRHVGSWGCAQRLRNGMAAGREKEKGTPGSCVPWHPDQREDSLLGRLILGILILVASIRLLGWLPSGFNEPPIKNHIFRRHK